MSLKRIILQVFIFALFFGCTVPESPDDTDSSAGDTGGSAPLTTAFLRINNNSGDNGNLLLGTWSDDLASRTAIEETGSLATGGTYDWDEFTPGYYDVWIRMGDSDFKLDDPSSLFFFAADSVYELTVAMVMDDLIWMLTDGNTTVLGAGTVTEYPDVPPATPATVTITSTDSSVNYIIQKCHNGSWTNDFSGRTLLSSSENFMRNYPIEWEAASGISHLWLEYGGLFYPLYSGGILYEADLAAGSEYTLSMTDFATWSLSDDRDSSLLASGEISSTGYAKYMPTLTSLYPQSGSTDVYINKRLYWYGNYADSYDFYFDTSDGSTLVATGLTDKEYYPDLDCETTYYWKVVAKNNAGQAESSVQSFTTESYLVPTITSVDSGFTNSKEFYVDFAFNVEYDEGSFTLEDLEVTGGAVLSVFRQFSDGTASVRVTMPDYDSNVTLTLPAGVVRDDPYLTRRGNLEATLSFEYYHIPMEQICNLVFDGNGGVWGVDRGEGTLFYIDPIKSVAVRSWDLPYDYPVDLDRIGNTLYIVYYNQPDITRFAVNTADPLTSAVIPGTYSIPLRSGETFDKAFDIAVDANGNRLFVLYQDTDWPDDHIVAQLNAGDGTSIGSPVPAGGNCSKGVLDFGGGHLVAGEGGSSRSTMYLYDAGSGAAPDGTPTLLDGPVSTDAFMSLLSLDLNDQGTRMAVYCDNEDLLPAGMDSGLVDFSVNSGSITYRGMWNEISIGKPQFSPDCRFLYGFSSSREELIVYSADDYSLIRTILFPDPLLYRVNPDGGSIIGYSQHDDFHRFNFFSDITD